MSASAGLEAASQDSDSSWALETVALKIHNILKVPCLSWAIDCSETKAKKKARKAGSDFSSEKWDNWRGVYVLAWTGILIGIWVWNPGFFWGRMIVGGVAAYRLYEIVVTALGTALGDEAQLKARNLITIGFYGLQLTLIFAVIYHSFCGGCFEPAKDSLADPHLASSDYLYISWANFTSLGQEAYTATSATAQFLEALTTTMGIMLLGVLLAFGINEVRAPANRKPAETPMPRKAARS
jgi:hypothetical protein